MVSVLVEVFTEWILPYFSRGHLRVSVAQGQKVVFSPAVSSAMCRMWVIFKAARVLALDMKHQQLPRKVEPHLQLKRLRGRHGLNTASGLQNEGLSVQIFLVNLVFNLHLFCV